MYSVLKSRLLWTPEVPALWELSPWTAAAAAAAVQRRQWSRRGGSMQHNASSAPGPTPDHPQGPEDREAEDFTSADLEVGGLWLTTAETQPGLLPCYHRPPRRKQPLCSQRRKLSLSSLLGEQTPRAEDRPVFCAIQTAP